MLSYEVSPQRARAEGLVPVQWNPEVGFLKCWLIRGSHLISGLIP